jgi:hypothetical protein
MSRLILKFFWSLSLIYYRHFNFLSWGSKSVQIFHFVLNLICSKLVQMLYLHPEIILTFSAFFWLAVWFLRIFYNIALFAFWKLLYIGFEHKLRLIVSSNSFQYLNRAASATSRMQIEQIRTHFEQPQIRFRTKCKIWTLFEPKYKNFKCLLKIEGSFKKILNIKRLMSKPSPLKQYHFHAILIWWHSPFNFISGKWWKNK